MTAVSPPSLRTRALAALAQAGSPGRLVAPQLDRMRTIGVRGSMGRSGPSDETQVRLAAKHAAAYRRIWDDAATAVGAEIERLADGFLLLRRRGVETLVYRHLVMLDHPATMALAIDKSAVHNLLERDGLPVPEHVELTRADRDRALEFLTGDPRPCVVKPASGTSGGTGVTCGVRTPDDLFRAWMTAGRWDSRILLERQVIGDEYRLIVLDGQVLDVVRRQRPRVCADGRNAVTQLIEDENRRRLDAGIEEVARVIAVDLDCELMLREQGLTPRSVAANGDSVTVKHAVGTNASADNATVRDMSPAICREAVRAAELAHLRFAGIDLVTPDPTMSLALSRGAVLEVNATPGLHYHYQVADPAGATPVAVTLLERLLDEGQPAVPR